MRQICWVRSWVSLARSKLHPEPWRERHRRRADTRHVVDPIATQLPSVIDDEQDKVAFLRVAERVRLNDTGTMATLFGSVVDLDLESVAPVYRSSSRGTRRLHDVIAAGASHVVRRPSWACGNGLVLRVPETQAKTSSSVPQNVSKGTSGFGS